MRHHFVGNKEDDNRGWCLNLCLSKTGGMLKTILKVMWLTLIVSLAGTLVDCLYQFYDLRNRITFALRVAELDSDQQLRKKVAGAVIRAGIRCEERDILVSRTESMVRAEVPYRYWIGVPFGGRELGLFSVGLQASGERAF